jgi:hypothetical protein
MLGVYDNAGIPYAVISPNPEIDMKQALMDEALATTQHLAVVWDPPVTKITALTLNSESMVLIISE